MLKQDVQKAIQYIEDAKAVLITAGAGMGVDSGLPDFRGDEGFWRAYPAIKELGVSFEDMADPKWFEKDPYLAWAFYGHRLNLYRDTTPHNGFKMLLDLVKSKNNNYFVYTSNVDGAFQKAGFDEDRVVEVHGSIHHLQCIHNCTKEIWSADDAKIDIDMKNFKALNLIKCKNCQKLARPNILMFNDWAWNSKRTQKQKDRFNRWVKILKKSDTILVIIEIGAGVVIPTIRIKGNTLAKTIKSANLIRINPQNPYINESFGVSFNCGGLDGLELILR